MTTDTPARPGWRCPKVIEAAVNDILTEVVGWLNDDHSEIDEVRRDLIRCADDDAYRFASNLESYCYWYPDAELVEVLSRFSPWFARDKAVREWVLAHSITVPFKVGDTVSLRGQDARIVDIRPETAEVVAQPVIPDGKSYGETGGWVHAAESIEGRQP